MVKPPRRYPKRNAVRALIEAATQFDPSSISGALARIYQTTHPSAAERDRERWELEITDQANRHSVIASGDIEATQIRQSYGIIGVTDNGTGDLSVHFDETAEGTYHVSLEPQGEYRVVDKKASGFRVQILDDHELIDGNINFVALRLPAQA
jgi:hypothetical protein